MNHLHDSETKERFFYEDFMKNSRQRVSWYVAKNTRYLHYTHQSVNDLCNE